MNTTVRCRNVYLGTANGRSYLVVVASQDEHGSDSPVDLTDPAKLAEIKSTLKANGINLGGQAQPGRGSNGPSKLYSQVQIAAHDESAKEHLLTTELVEEYQLSSGSTLYFLYVPSRSGDYQWLVGRRIELNSLGKNESERTAGLVPAG